MFKVITRHAYDSSYSFFCRASRLSTPYLNAFYDKIQKLIEGSPPLEIQLLPERVAPLTEEEAEEMWRVIEERRRDRTYMSAIFQLMG